MGLISGTVSPFMQQWILPDGLTGSPVVYIAVAVVAFGLTAVAKGGFGGVGILGVPLMMMVVPDDASKFVLGLWLPLLVLCDIWTVKSFAREWTFRPLLLLSPWVVVGLFAGAMLLGIITDQAVKVFVGALAIMFAVLEWTRARATHKLEEHGKGGVWTPTWWTAAPFGLGVGISTMIAHSAGVITAIYLLAQRLDRRTFAGTSGRFYLVVNTVKIPYYAQLGIVNTETLIKGIWLIPLAPLGVWLGAMLNRRMSPAAFNRAINVLLLLSGVFLLYQNVGGQ